MNVLDLFSGIGGFSLGLERAGMRTVAFCEIDPFCRHVLAKHWPHVPVYDDVRTLTAERLRADGIVPDVICGGFPCQDISTVARSDGDPAGIEGARSGLWREYARLIGELRPGVVIVENVAGLLERGLGRVLGDLATLGYDAEWHCISVGHVGGPIIRDRLWLAAFPDGERLARGSFWGKEFWRQATLVGADVWRPLPECGGHRSRAGIPFYVERTTALGNSVAPIIPEIIGRAIMSAEPSDTREAGPITNLRER